MGELVSVSNEIKRQKRHRVWCCKCFKRMGYSTLSRVKWYGALEKVLKYYLCRRCRRYLDYGKYLKQVRENGMV